MICLPLDISDGFPNRGGTAGMLSQRVKVAGGNYVGNDSVFSAHVCPVHHDNNWGGHPPHPQCPQCDILVLWKALNDRQFTTSQCAKGSERKRRWLVTKETRERATRAFRLTVGLLIWFHPSNTQGRSWRRRTTIGRWWWVTSGSPGRAWPVCQWYLCPKFSLCLFNWRCII